MITEEQINKNFENYKEKLNSYFGENANALIEYVGGEDAIKHAVFGSTTDSGVAYDGSLLACVNGIISFAKKINELFPQSQRASEESIEKVAMISHIAKVMMFEENDNSWEKTNRGMLYKFTKLDGALRCGERSLMIAMNAGIKLTPEEFEAVRIMDKSGADDTYTKIYSSTLSTVIRQANEIIIQIKRVK